MEWKSMLRSLFLDGLYEWATKCMVEESKRHSSRIANIFVLYTYIHSWSLQSFSQDYVLGSHINFIYEWRHLQFKVVSEYPQFKVVSERQNFFEKLFHGNFIYSSSFCQKSAERKSPKKYFSYFVFLQMSGLPTRQMAYMFVNTNNNSNYFLDYITRALLIVIRSMVLKIFQKSYRTVFQSVHYTFIMLRSL